MKRAREDAAASSLCSEGSSSVACEQDNGSNESSDGSLESDDDDYCEGDDLPCKSTAEAYCSGSDSSQLLVCVQLMFFFPLKQLEERMRGERMCIFIIVIVAIIVQRITFGRRVFFAVAAITLAIATGGVFLWEGTSGRREACTAEPGQAGNVERGEQMLSFWPFIE
jgi:hypothetical protein